jgi:O-antigen ligase
MESRRPMFAVRCLYYAFVFVIPFEDVLLEAGIGTGSFTPTKMIGYLLVMSALLQPSLCFRRPPKAFWYFAAYMLVYLVLTAQVESQFHRPAIARLVKLAQMLILLWISSNIMRYDRAIKGTLLAIATSTTVLSVLQVLGITSRVITQERITAAGGSTNAFAGVLVLGLLALLGVAYSRKDLNKKLRWLAWLGFGSLAMAIVGTGSRGPMVALAAGLLIFLLKGESLLSKLKTGLILIVALGAFLWASFQVEALRVRWESTLIEGKMSKRETLFPAAWQMFKEKPLAGWGPIRYRYHLGDRMPKEAFYGRDVTQTDPHNLYLVILTETGLLGAVPFFAALWLCGRAAWRARDSIQGVLPLAMLVCLLTINMTASGYNRKLFWIVLAYALASGSYVALPRLLKPVTQRYQLVRP